MKRIVFIVSSIIAGSAVVFAATLPLLKRHAELTGCSNQMHAVLFAAALVWPDEHGGRLPSDFLSISNELGSPRLLVCPGDHLHQPATSWVSLSASNCSYEIVAPGLLKGSTNQIFMRCTIHGNVGYADDRLLDRSGKLVRPKSFW
jgi:hypothetical protein